jgi:hypothetical protein
VLHRVHPGRPVFPFCSTAHAALFEPAHDVDTFRIGISLDAFTLAWETIVGKLAAETRRYPNTSISAASSCIQYEANRIGFQAFSGEKANECIINKG